MLVTSLNINSSAAQEPTQEPDQSQVIVVSEGEAEAVPSADVVVLQQETPQVQEKDTIVGIIEKLTIPIIAVAGFIMVMLSSKNREKALGVAEVVEDIATAAALSTNELISAIGGNPNIVVSTDPKVLAAALKTGDKHVLIRQGISFDSIVKEYTPPPTA